VATDPIQPPVEYSTPPRVRVARVSVIAVIVSAVACAVSFIFLSLVAHVLLEINEIAGAICALFSFLVGFVVAKYAYAMTLPLARVARFRWLRFLGRSIAAQKARRLVRRVKRSISEFLYFR